jgi:hypothetical protein
VRLAGAARRRAGPLHLPRRRLRARAGAARQHVRGADRAPAARRRHGLLPGRARPRPGHLVHPPARGHRIKLARGSGECTARIVNERGTKAIDLAPFCQGLRHDWSGKVAAAYADLACGRAREAAEALEPIAAKAGAVSAAHHLLGRCHRALGHLPEAIECYRKAVRASADEDGKLRPWAAAPLSDMGVAYKRSGDAARAPSTASCTRSTCGPTTPRRC